MKIYLFCLLFLVAHTISYGQQQENNLFQEDEYQLKFLLDDLRSAKDDDSILVKNERFKLKLKQTLAKDNAFDYPFASLTKSVGIIKSADDKIEIINWNIELQGFKYKYFGFVLVKNPKKNKATITELVDNPNTLSLRTDEVLDLANWYGGLYYSIVVKSKGTKTYYTLLGWDSGFTSSNFKFIDVLTISGNVPKLGAPIFKTKEGVKKRVVFEFSEKASMALKFEKEYDRIVFDHLSPEESNLTGFYSYYVPDMSYDAFKFEQGTWVLKEDVVTINNGGNEKTRVVVKNEKTGDLEVKEIKNKYENPNVNGSPEIALPEEKINETNSKTKNKKTKVKSDTRDPSQMESTLGTKKKKRKRN